MPGPGRLNRSHQQISERATESVRATAGHTPHRVLAQPPRSITQVGELNMSSASCGSQQLRPEDASVIRQDKMSLWRAVRALEDSPVGARWTCPPHPPTWRTCEVFQHRDTTWRRRRMALVANLNLKRIKYSSKRNGANVTESVLNEK